MAGQTKMIIITSNEEVIRQFSLQQTNQIQIIDLDHVKHTASDQNDGNISTNLDRLVTSPESVCTSLP